MTLHDPSLSSDVAEMFWAHPTTNTYKGINISNCAKINITIVASKGSVISWYLKPESAQAASNTVKYGHELGYYATGPVFKSHKYCIPHGNYRFVAKSRLSSGWGSIGSFSVSCQQFERLGGKHILPQQAMQAAINQENLFSTSSCKLINAYMYGTELGKNHGEDIMVKRPLTQVAFSIRSY